MPEPHHRRVNDKAARGLPSLISFVNRAKQFYQLRLVDAVAVVDAERARRNEYATASASASANRGSFSPSGTWRSRA